MPARTLKLNAMLGGAMQALKAFLTKERLGHFTADRNDPNKPEALSGLSPYLHYGQLGAQRMAYDAKQLRSKLKVLSSSSCLSWPCKTMYMLF